jgi:superfamily II DNA or RNA helicase
LAPTNEERSDFFRRGQVNINRIRHWQTTKPNRNKAIARMAQNAAKDGHKVLVLSHLKQEHIPALQKELPGCGVVTGDIKGQTRLDNLAQNDIVIGTMGAAEEALDRSDLSVAIVTTTFNNDKEFQQSSGRIARSFPGKNHASYIVLVDEVPKCVEHAKGLERAARRRGYKIEHFKEDL